MRVTDSWGMWSETHQAPCGCKPRGPAPIYTFSMNLVDDEIYVSECRQCDATINLSDLEEYSK